jgi:asparagine synthase (glutamine-hydrolysing)
MANFILIIDPDPVRRRAAASKAYDRVAFLPRLHADLTVTPQYALAWAAAPHAPVTRAVSTDNSGPDCILFGEPHDMSGASVAAEDLRRRHETDWGRRDPLNGFYSALLIHPWHGVRAEADVLGMFPLYHWQSGDVLLISTSPELFRCHSAFQSSMDLHGVAALLLTSGIVGGRTLWRGVRRLPADHVLFCPPGAAVREVAPPSTFEESTVDNLDEAVEQASALHISFLQSALKSSRMPGLLLSGGLDSRLLAGFTTELNHRPTCLTFGRRGDLDARCATQVARELNLPQTLCDVDAADYAGYATSSVVWEQLSGGLYALPMGWNISVRPPEVTMDRMVCGLSLDAVIGAVLGGPKNMAGIGDALSFERLQVGRLGYDRHRLEPLLAAPELTRACDEVRDELIQHFLAAGHSNHQREWRMDLAHRHRFAVGACAWRYSMFAWPVLPALDHKLIQLTARLAHSVVKQRQVQIRMLVSCFPRLARLELDRNYLDTTPLLGAKRSLVYDLRRRLVKLNRRCHAWLGRDPRFYVRTMAFNSPGWRVVRSLADEARTAIHALFRPEALARILPDSRVSIRHVEDPIMNSAPLKNTLGLMLWMRQHT